MAKLGILCLDAIHHNQKNSHSLLYRRSRICPGEVDMVYGKDQQKNKIKVINLQYCNEN